MKTLILFSLLFNINTAFATPSYNGCYLPPVGAKACGIYANTYLDKNSYTWLSVVYISHAGYPSEDCNGQNEPYYFSLRGNGKFMSDYGTFTPAGKNLISPHGYLLFPGPCR